MTDLVQLEVCSPGAYSSVQDLGRRGWRRVGVPWAGVLDSRLMRLANALVGNEADAPVLECFDGGLQLAARGAPVRLAVTGHAELEIEAPDGQRRSQPAWCSLTLREDETLRLRSLLAGRMAVVAVQGLSLPLVLGSTATYARAGLGGLDGRVLTKGLRMPAAAAVGTLEQVLPQPPAAASTSTADALCIHAVPGPQDDHFKAETLAAFVAADYQVSSEADRMGVRLQGPALGHIGAPEIVSDATVPGSVQVPGSGQPIVLLADAQTAGGYPKIATVVSADLPRLASLRPGQHLRFEWVTAEQGQALAREAESQLQALLASIRPLLGGGVDVAALYAGNLVSGMVHALSPE